MTATVEPWDGRPFGRRPGGLVVDADSRLLRADGTPFDNLFAGGGAARMISGPHAAGYLAGNGLVTATTLGRLAGQAAARLI